MLFCMFVLPNSVLNAQIQGPLSGGSFTTVNIPGSNQTWISPGNASSSDDIYTNFGNLTGGVGAYSDYLVATNFAFNIPIGVTVNGIIVEVERSDPNFRTADYRVRIVKGGSIGSAERASGSSYPFSDSYQSYGNAGDLWGDTWSPADINSSGFGVAISAQRSIAGGTTNGRIDHIRIFVFYNFTTLPVRLISFTALKNSRSVEIGWSTADEINISHYEVERSANASDFVNLQSVTSKNLAQQTTYFHTDKNPLPGKSFYRLKTVERNGVVNYSKIISVQFDSRNIITLYPTLWKNGTPLYISELVDSKLVVNFYSLAGQHLGFSLVRWGESSFIPFLNAKSLILYRILKEDGVVISTGKIKAD